MRAKIIAPAFFVVLTLGLAACSSAAIKGANYSEDPNIRYPITVMPDMRSMDLPVAAASNMAPDLKARFAAFVRDYVEHGTGAISVSAPPGRDDAARALAEDVADFGIPRDRILLGTDRGRDQGGAIKVSYIRYIAQTKPCGDWSTNLGNTFDNELPPNWGCATQQNIAAMVADPRDLVAPGPMTAADTQRALTILDKYRKGAPTPAEKTQEQSATIADVGNGGGGGGN